MKPKNSPAGFDLSGRFLLVLALTLAACQRKSSEPAGDAAQPPPSFTVTPPIPAGADDLFEDVTAKAGITFVQQFCDDRIANILESNGSGVAVFDYDNDGYMDLYFVNPGPLAGVTHEAPGTRREPNRLFHNNGDGTFTDVTATAGVGGQGFAIAAAAADYDGDGWTDLYVINVGKNILYHNNHDGTFTDVTDRAGVGDTGTGIGATWLDVNGDGRLDLYVGNYLSFDPNYKLYYNPTSYPGPLAYKPERDVLCLNNGDGTFTNATESSGIAGLEPHRTMSVCPLDYNRDGHPDLYLCNDATPNQLLINDGHGHFHDEAMKLGIAFNALGEAAGSMTAAIGDCNGDGRPDILVSRLGYGSLYMAAAQGDFIDRMMASGLGVLTAQYVGWGCNFIDFDNAGKPDVFIANGDAFRMVGWQSLLLENDGQGNFRNAVDKGGAYFRTPVRARASVVLDYDNDGRMDLLVGLMGDRPVLLHNRDRSGNHWISLALRGTKSNPAGWGSFIELTADGKKYVQECRCPSAFLSQSDPRVHFGLGQAKTVERIEIKWPSGTVQTLTDVRVDQILKVTEP
ncbi:MAG TPA: CRTAC1 family protein [Opitutaceae bacterium]|nr:CRTAC1 family protein [Opitutaceae bacterium]